jgi:hypothetical protein
METWETPGGTKMTGTPNAKLNALSVLTVLVHNLYKTATKAQTLTQKALQANKKNWDIDEPGSAPKAPAAPPAPAPPKVPPRTPHTLVAKAAYTV